MTFTMPWDEAEEGRGHHDAEGSTIMLGGQASRAPVAFAIGRGPSCPLEGEV